MNSLAVFWIVVIYVALFSFTIMSVLIIFQAYFELKEMLVNMGTNKQDTDTSIED